MADHTKPLTFYIRVRLTIGFLAWCCCMAIPPRGRVWWSVLPAAGFYAHFDRDAWNRGGYDHVG